MSRKGLLSLFSILIIAAMALAACAPAAAPTAQVVQVTVPVKETVQVQSTVVVEKLITPTAAPAGPVTITFWHGYNADVETKYLEGTIIPAFQAKFPNITVKAVNIPYDQFRRKLLVAMSGGTAPDLARIDIIWTPELADQGALAQLDVVMPDFAKLKDTFLPGPLSTNFFNGHYYGLPLDTNTRVLVYNKDIFKQEGVPLPDGKKPMTWDQYLEKAKLLTRDANGKRPGESGFAEDKLYRGMHRFLPSILRLQGYRVVEQFVHHRPRTRGQSKYGMGNRLWRGMKDCLAMRWYKARCLRGDRVAPE